MHSQQVYRSLPAQQRAEGRTGRAQDISPGYLTYLVGIYDNITFYSHPFNTLHLSTDFFGSHLQILFLVHTDDNYMKVQQYFYLQHLHVPMKSTQGLLQPYIKLLPLVLNRIPVIRIFSNEGSCHSPHHHSYCKTTPMPCQLLHVYQGYLWTLLSRTLTHSNLFFCSGTTQPKTHYYLLRNGSPIFHIYCSPLFWTFFLKVKKSVTYFQMKYMISCTNLVLSIVIFMQPFFFPSGQVHHRETDEHKYFSQMWLWNGEQNGATENCDLQQTKDSIILREEECSLSSHPNSHQKRKSKSLFLCFFSVSTRANSLHVLLRLTACALVIWFLRVSLHAP